MRDQTQNRPAPDEVYPPVTVSELRLESPERRRSTAENGGVHVQRHLGDYDRNHDLRSGVKAPER